MYEQWYWHVYIIECLDGSYYTGCTRSPANRMDQHLSHYGSKYTRRHGVKRVAHLEAYDSLEAARTREKQIKGWTRQKKEKLINGEWHQLN
ncbi:MAG: GIY-YIG nuclease family protein [Candidatus Kerfeldbacteria bacterium]|nr:GIY-YIG nuclease family protein [Candidatus Kerfeldbacteria bacterium]